MMRKQTNSAKIFEEMCLKGIMIEGVSTMIVNLTSGKTSLVRTVKLNSTVGEFNLISHFITTKKTKQKKKKYQSK